MVGSYEEIAYKDVLRVGNVEEIFAGVGFNEFRESLPVANKRLKLSAHVAGVVRIVVCLQHVK